MKTTTHPDPERGAGRNLQGITQLLPYVTRYRWNVLAAVIALFVAATGVLALGQGLRFVIDEGFVTADPQLLDRALLVTLAIVAVLAAASALRFYWVSRLGERVCADLRYDVFHHVLSLEPAFFERNGAGEIQSRLTTDTTLLQSLFGSSLSVAARNVLVLIGAVIMLFITSPYLTAMVLAGIPLVVIPILFFGRRVRRLSRASQDRVADVGNHAAESLGAIDTVQAFGHEDTDRRRFRGDVEQAFDTAMERIRQRALLTGMALLFVFTAVGVVLWQGGHDVLSGRMTPGELSAFVFYAVLAAGSVAAVSEVIGDVYRAAGAAERLLELLYSTPTVAAPLEPQPLPTPARGELSFRGVTFAYPARPQTPALEDFDLELKRGERVALVGPSGAGKSTVISLALRFHDPDRGAVLMDGVDLRRADPREVRRRIGLVPQEPTLFTGNALENIRYGSPEAGEEEVLQAAADAGCIEFLERLPHGLHTELGPGGVQLSGGQRQRLAIARAILRDPALLLLDEATSQLDAESEHQVQTALERLMAGRSTLIIAHRLATVRAADRIVVMDHGRVCASGSHMELLGRSPLYARLAELQLRASA